MHTVTILQIIIILTIKCFTSYPAEQTIEDKNQNISQNEYCNERIGAKTDYVVSLRVWIALNDTFHHFCGGTLIAEVWVLTAARCFDDHTIQGETIFAAEGASLGEFFKSALISTVKDIYIHKNYSAARPHNNIALVALDAPLLPDSFSYYAKLPYKFDGDIKAFCSDASLIGWGMVEEQTSNAVEPDMLMCIKLKLITNCANQTRGVINLSEENICTEGYQQKNCWIGDYGVPLLCAEVQYGILSFYNASNDLPFVYTRVDAFLDFIYDTIRTETEVDFRSCGTQNIATFIWYLQYVFLLLLFKI